MLFQTFYCLPLSSSRKTHPRHWTYINVCRVSFGGVSNMLLVPSITFYFHYNIWGCMCSTGPFKYRWLKGYIYSSCYYHHQIGSIHLSHCFHIFQWLCACDVCYIIFCHLLHIHCGKTGDLFSLVLCSLWSSANGRIRFGLQIVFICLYITPSHYHHCANFIWRHWTYKMPVRYNLSCVSKIKHIFSVIQSTICGAVCFQFTHSLCDDWENIYTLSYYHHQIGSMNYYPLFRVRSWNNGMRCMSFLCMMLAWLLTSPGHHGACYSLHTIYIS